LSGIKDLEIDQQTPIRVLHRRPLQTRKRTVHGMSTQYINQRFFQLDIVTSAGTYVKEFVHSDLGRTQPNLSTFLGKGIDTDILQLDVTEVIDEEGTLEAAGNGDKTSLVNDSGKRTACETSDKDMLSEKDLKKAKLAHEDT